MAGARRRLDRPYSRSLIEVSFLDEYPRRWTFGGQQVKGMAIEYDVFDLNYPNKRRWTFRVSVPDEDQSCEYTEVRPIGTCGMDGHTNDPAGGLPGCRGLTFKNC